MFVQYWPVGTTSAESLPMTTGDVSGHLLADWIPSFPAALGASFLGWPQFLITTVTQRSKLFLTLASVTGSTERQWKGVLSWMLGVAGARHVLQSEGYRWIAPLSAFYPNAAQPVATSFPLSSVSASRDPNSSCRLLPDYLALRPNPVGQGTYGYDWAVAEAKGSSSSLTNMDAAPSAWSNQVRNVIVTANGQAVTIPRHLVICTRVHPNAKREQTRRIQLRCWNRKSTEGDKIPTAAAADVAAAHLFGLFRGLGMPGSASALALSVRVRAAKRDGRSNKFLTGELEKASNIALGEIRERSISGSTETLIRLPTESGNVEIGLATPLLDLVLKLYQSHTDDDVAVAMQIADDQLDRWEVKRRGDQDSSRFAVLKSGVTFGVRPSLL